MNYDFNKDIVAWMYIKDKKVTFDVSAKKEDEFTAEKEFEHTGVWFLGNSCEEMSDEDTNDVYVTEIPIQYHNHPSVIKAKEAELDNYEKYDAYEEVPFENQNLITSRWNITQKDGKTKARLCVRGFQEERPPQSDSPTASQESYNCLLYTSPSPRD